MTSPWAEDWTEPLPEPERPRPVRREKKILKRKG